MMTSRSERGTTLVVVNGKTVGKSESGALFQVWLDFVAVELF